MINFEVDDIHNMNANLAKFIDYLNKGGLDGDCVFFSRLIACELITNALRYTGGAAQFSGEIDGDEVIITVRSQGVDTHLKIPNLPEVLAESGRGLYIINAISGGNVTFSNGDVTVKMKWR